MARAHGDDRIGVFVSEHLFERLKLVNAVEFECRPRKGAARSVSGTDEVPRQVGFLGLTTQVPATMSPMRRRSRLKSGNSMKMSLHISAKITRKVSAVPSAVCAPRNDRGRKISISRMAFRATTAAPAVAPHRAQRREAPQAACWALRRGCPSRTERTIRCEE